MGDVQGPRGGEKLPGLLQIHTVCQGLLWIPGGGPAACVRWAGSALLCLLLWALWGSDVDGREKPGAWRR